MIEIQKATKVFSKSGKPAADDVSFTVANGEIVGFVGLNGAGKSTTIRMAAGVSLPTSGRVFVDGHDVVTERSRRANVSAGSPSSPTSSRTRRRYR